MNSIVAIGGPELRQAANAYRAIVPSAVWVLGLRTSRDPRDQLVRSLDSLVEPFMAPYFAAEAEMQVAAMSAGLASLLLPARGGNAERSVNAVSATMQKDVAATLALVAMLDSAHAIQPVELVLNDDSSALARAAVAWALARGVPSVSLPARVPLRRPRKPCADLTIALGERSIQSYRALGVTDSKMVNLAPTSRWHAPRTDTRAERRLSGKASLTRALGWHESEIVVVFEPAATRQSALEPAEATGESLAAIFSALVYARANHGTVRLAILGDALLPGYAKVAQAAANAGLTGIDFAYGDADHDVWIAAADIFVSVDSPRSMDATSAGVPAINLWHPANWYLGPAFAAEDGILDVPPLILGPTLVALAKDDALRRQIAEIAMNRMTTGAPVGAELAALLGAELVKHRRVPMPRRLPYGRDASERAARKRAGRALLKRDFGWMESDIVVVFENPDTPRRPELETARTSRESLAALFNAFVLARANVPILRLAIIGALTKGASKIVAETSADAGLGASDFAYGNADYDAWIAAADVVVSVDSSCSMDAARAGVAAINLCSAANSNAGPSTVAPDGVLYVPPDRLGPALLATAERYAKSLSCTVIDDVITVPEPTGAGSAPVLAERLPEPPHLPIRIASNEKPDIVICAPPYQHASAGLRALYRLCHFINLAGGNASIFPGTRLHPSWNTPQRDTDLTDRTIVVYPEIYHQALPAKRVVRWVLNEPGLLGGPKSYGDEEMVFYYHPAYRAAAQAATTEPLTAERELRIAVIEPEIFYHDRSLLRVYDCIFVYKGQALYDRLQHRETRDAYVIRSGWPASRIETAALLRGCRRLYSFDGNSAIVTEGIICGAEVFMVRQDGFGLYTGTEGFNVEDYERQYYDMAPARRFLELIHERWG